jgi:hypothetical protein
MKRKLIVDAKDASLRVGVLVSALLLALLLVSCTPPDASSGSSNGSTGTDTRYAALAAASGLDARSDAWINLVLAAEEQTGAGPTVTLSYGASEGDEAGEDGAAKVVYSGETGASMHLQVFARMSPQSLPTSASQVISVKVKPVAGCVKKAIAFVATRDGGWYASAQPVSLTADAWTTVTVTVDASTFTAGVWRIGVQLNGDTLDPDAQFAAAGTVYVDDFNALDYRKNDFSSVGQLVNSLYVGSDDGTGYVQSWEAGSVSGDGNVLDTITFPGNVSAGWGTWIGCDFTTQIYGVNTAVDVSNSTIVFRIYVPQAAMDALALTNSGTWLSVYHGGNSAEIDYTKLNTMVTGWNTVRVNFTEPKLKTDAGYCSNFTYDYTQVDGFNVGIGTANATNQGVSFTFKVDYVDIIPN